MFSECKKEELKWFKGNTHSHTTLSGHADTHPDTVALWYFERDYNFLILSEHNQFIDPDHVHLPVGRRNDFILIPCEEVSELEEVHATGMNMQKKVNLLYPKNMASVTDNPFDNIKTYLM